MNNAQRLTLPEPAGSDDGPSSSIEALLVPALGPGYNMALRLTRNPPDAADLLQDAAVLACRFAHQFKPGTNFRAWFFKILTNCFYKDRRQQRRRGEEIELEEAPPLYLYSRMAEAGLNQREMNPAAFLLARLDGEQIGRALDQLPNEYRMVASLYFADELKYEEIAEVLDIPLGTVQSRLHRARRILQQKLWDIALEYGIVTQSADDRDG